jgi:DNA-binding Lrp family transcriptional regulator
MEASPWGWERPSLRADRGWRRYSAERNAESCSFRGLIAVQAQHLRRIDPLKTVSAVELDAIDRKMLRLLQQDGRITNADLARQVALSESACLRRLRALEAAGVISRYAAVINERAVGLPISVFVTVTLSSQSEAALSAFEQAVAAAPEVMECYLMTGGADYLLRLVVKDVDDLERLHAKTLTRLPGVHRVSSSVAMRSVVKRGALPV